MHLFKAFAHEKMRKDRVVMAIVAPDSSGIELPTTRFRNIKNSGHGGLANKTFGLALRNFFFLSRCDFVFRFQPVTVSAAIPVLRPSCIERSLKRAGEWTSVTSHAHISKTSLHETLHRLLAWAFLEMHSTSIQDPSISQSLALCFH